MCVLSKQQQQGSDEPKNASSSGSNSDSVTAILDFMNNYAQKLRFSANKDFVLILGNTGTGKSTLTSLLTGAELKSEEIMAGQFRIVDESGLISGVSTTTSKTIVPELMIDKENGIIYYDCPGFNDSRGVVNDMSVTYLIQQLIKYAKQLKLVFTVSYSSVKMTGDRRDFMDLAKHATAFVKNVDEFRDGIALVVTKVENHYVKVNGQLHMVDDHKEIEGIIEFLKQAKLDLEHRNHDDILMEEQEISDNIIKFIDTLLQSNDQKEYDKIEILRLADEIGPVEDIEILQTEKNAIKSMIFHKIQYVRSENSHFGYTISDESKNRIHDIIEQLQSRLTNDLLRIGVEIQDFYLQEEKYNTDFKKLKEMLSNGYQKLSAILSKDLKLFVEQTVETANTLGIGVTFDSSNQIWRHIECVEFVKTISNNNLSSFFDISRGLNSTMHYLDESRKWYQFLIDLHDELSKYKFQKHLPHSNPTITILQKLWSTGGEKDEITSVDLGLNKFLGEIQFATYYSQFDNNIRLNSFKVKALRTVLYQTTRHIKPIENHDSLEIRGYNVKMSDVMAECKNHTKYIKVFALNNLFIDTDFDGTGKQLQLSLIAPKWCVIDDRKIILSGENGKPHLEPKAKDDAGLHTGGEDGHPGNPGGPSGHFMAIGNEVIDGRNLEIHINGGMGGAGQHGGNGA